MTDTVSSRRSFLKAGALIAGPLAATVPAAVLAADGDYRPSSLLDEAAIHRLHQDWMRAINTGTPALRPATLKDVRSIVGDPAGDPDAIRVAADGSRATGRFACTIETVTELHADSTFAQMAHAQGGGSTRSSQRGVLSVEYRKAANAWTIAGIAWV